MDNECLNERMKKQKQGWIVRMKATEWAKARLKDEGHHYPLHDKNKSPAENYDAIRAYGEREARYIKQYLLENEIPKPIESQPKQEWQKKYD